MLSLHLQARTRCIPSESMKPVLYRSEQRALQAFNLSMSSLARVDAASRHLRGGMHAPRPQRRCRAMHEVLLGQLY